MSNFISHLRRFSITKLKAFAICALLTLALLPTNTFAQCGADASGGVTCPAAGVIQVQELLTRMINISVTLAFMAVTIWLAWAAIKFFITSGGDPKALAQAWSSVTWTFMGLVFMILAYLALKLVAGFTGADVTKYCLGLPPYCI